MQVWLQWWTASDSHGCNVDPINHGKPQSRVCNKLPMQHSCSPTYKKRCCDCEAEARTCIIRLSQENERAHSLCVSACMPSVLSLMLPCTGPVQPKSLNSQYFPGYVGCGLAYAAGLTIATAGLYIIGLLSSIKLHDKLITTVSGTPCFAKFTDVMHGIG